MALFFCLGFFPQSSNAHSHALDFRNLAAYLPLRNTLTEFQKNYAPLLPVPTQVVVRKRIPDKPVLQVYVNRFDFTVSEHKCTWSLLLTASFLRKKNLMDKKKMSDVMKKRLYVAMDVVCVLIGKL